MIHIIQDRYGYWLSVAAESEIDAIRKSSNLSDEANLEYATTSYIGLASDVSDEEFEKHNCSIAMENGINHCQCGYHKEV